MSKRWVVLVMIGCALLLHVQATAQRDAFRVWIALPDQDTEELLRFAEDFAAQAGLELEAVRMEAALLTEAIVKADAPPDVVLAANTDAEPLVAAGMVARLGTRGFFLQDLLTAYPELAEQVCGREALEMCLWPNAAEVMPLEPPQPRVISLATTALCDSAPWLPFCEDSVLAMAPLGWDLQLYLVSADWLSEQGLDLPRTAADVLQLRREYAFSIVEAEAGRIPTAESARLPKTYLLSSTLLADDPDAVMVSLASFWAADYWPVLTLNLYGVYVGAQAQHPDLAAQFAQAASDDPRFKTRLMGDSGRLPALLPQELLGAGDDVTRQTLQTLALLTTYAVSAR